MTVDILWLFLTEPWVGMQCVISIYPDLTHLLFSGFSNQSRIEPIAGLKIWPGFFMSACGYCFCPFKCDASVG